MGLDAVLNWKGVVRAFQTSQLQVVDRISDKDTKEVNVKVIFYFFSPTANRMIVTPEFIETVGSDVVCQSSYLSN